jgi:hypothetical protein
MADFLKNFDYAQISDSHRGSKILRRLIPHQKVQHTKELPSVGI